MPPTTAQFEYTYDTRARDWSNCKALRMLCGQFEANLEQYRQTLRHFGSLDADLATISIDRETSSPEPHWNNIWLPPLDCVALCGFLATRSPKRYVEIGSGNSTKFARWGIRKWALPTRIISIDPAPRAEIDGLCDDVIRAPLEYADQAIFAELERDDVVFVDCSHRSFPNSDVTVFFMEILPVLAKGCVVALHDIFLPFDYPAEWDDRFYNEQYLLAAYLFGGADGGKILMPVHYIGRVQPQACIAPFPSLNRMGLPMTEGGAFFMER